MKEKTDSVINRWRDSTTAEFCLTDDTFGDAVRVAVLLQPFAMKRARSMAVVQVVETLELRRTLARQILFDTQWRQLVLVSVIVPVVFVVVQRATRTVDSGECDWVRRLGWHCARSCA